MKPNDQMDGLIHAPIKLRKRFGSGSLPAKGRPDLVVRVGAHPFEDKAPCAIADIRRNGKTIDILGKDNGSAQRFVSEISDRPLDCSYSPWVHLLRENELCSDPCRKQHRAAQQKPTSEHPEVEK